MKRRNIELGLTALVVFAGLFYLYGGTPDSERSSTSRRSKFGESE